MMDKHEKEDLQSKLEQELRRGVLVLAALSQLGDSKYGYELMSDLAEQGLEIEQGTLYPLLRRLEEQGLLQSEWNVESSRPRRYYRLSPDGSELLEKLKASWLEQTAVMRTLLD